MAKFRVTVKEVHNQDYVVDADNAKQAKQLIEDNQGDIDEGSFCYNYSLEPEYWDVTEVK